MESPANDALGRRIEAAIRIQVIDRCCTANICAPFFSSSVSAWPTCNRRLEGVVSDLEIIKSITSKVILSMQSGFNQQLKQRRQAAGISQLGLALDADVSTRHLSFLETGRAKPSRAMVLRLSDAMDLPLRDRNDLLLAAGFAPQYAEHGLADDELAQARNALTFLLEMHEPYPAFVLDRLWNIVLWNRPHERLIKALSSGELDIAELNAMDLVCEPGPIRERIVNWPVVARAVVGRLESQLAQTPSDIGLIELWERVSSYPGIEALDREPTTSPTDILIPLEMRLDEITVSLFNTLAVFGTAQEVTLSELVIESFFPADDATRKFIATLTET